jgi:hypothetical protein
MIRRLLTRLFSRRPPPPPAPVPPAEEPAAVWVLPRYTGPCETCGCVAAVGVRHWCLVREGRSC